MALVAINVTIGQSLGGGVYSSTVKGGAAPSFAAVTSNLGTVTTDLATVSADVAVLVADAASPTQGHVNTLNTDLTALNTAYTAATTANTALAAATSADVSVIWDTTKITTITQLRAALRSAIDGAASGLGALTP